MMIQYNNNAVSWFTEQKGSQNTEEVLEKLSTPHDSTACRNTFSCIILK